jgi:Domain of unknown function (DUF4326)
MINIVNRKTYRGESIYIGRPSVLGNPFVIGRDGDRATAISKYRRWLWNEIQRGSGPVFEEIQRLAELGRTSDLVLGCWCRPQSCHGEILASAIVWLNRSAGSPEG